MNLKSQFNSMQNGVGPCTTVFPDLLSTKPQLSNVKSKNPRMVLKTFAYKTVLDNLISLRIFRSQTPGTAIIASLISKL